MNYAHCEITASSKEAIDIYLAALSTRYSLVDVSRPTDTQVVFNIENQTDAIMDSLHRQLHALAAGCSLSVTRQIDNQTSADNEAASARLQELEQTLVGTKSATIEMLDGSRHTGFVCGMNRSMGSYNNQTTKAEGHVLLQTKSGTLKLNALEIKDCEVQRL